MSSQETLLCVANFPSGTGYAWDFFEGLFARVADRLALKGIETAVAYPKLPERPEALANSAAEAIQLPIHLTSPIGLGRLLRFIWKRNVRTVFFIDRGRWHPAFPILRAAGVKKIVAYDESSGARIRPTGVKRLLKAGTRRIPGTLADSILTVSNYVARRHIEVSLIPEERLETVWNGVPIPDIDQEPNTMRVRADLGIEADTPLVACTCRATEVKGVQHLFRAFERLSTNRALASSRPVLVYVGDGPYMQKLRDLRQSLRAHDRIMMTGYRNDAARIVGAADIAVVPSVWQEAFGIAVLEPMVRGVPVVASSVGGIPEIVDDGTTGLLVPPGDEKALTRALCRLLERPDESRQMGRAGRKRAERLFDLERQITKLTEVLSEAFNSEQGLRHG